MTLRPSTQQSPWPRADVPSAAALRQQFVEFFAERGSVNLPSSSLVPPHNDPTVLLTLAGMQQMIPFFIGLEPPPAPRLTSVQKCFRTVDIDEVGDETHLTFFEMLGNFSVGDYFKEGAIRFAWEFFTEELGIPGDRLWTTVYPTDDVARGLWRDTIGLPPSRIHDDPTNWWGPVGPSGPCGPNSEIHVDRGVERGCGEADCNPTCERPGCARFVELWNLVFMEFYRNESGADTPLPRQNIDTGMGLERLAMVLQNRDSVYETDLYAPIIDRAARLAERPYGVDAAHDRALRVIADHSRGIVFLIGDGVLPSNEGRGYILRRVLRRAARYGRLLGVRGPFLAETAAAAIDLMSGQYPELDQQRDYIFRIIRHEEGAFDRTLAQGINRFEALAAKLRDDGRGIIPGSEAFRLYDTYGFPFELTAELAAEHGFSTSREDFDRAAREQRERSRRLSRFSGESHRDLELYAGLHLPNTRFLGYERERAAGEVLAIIGPDGPLDAAMAGEHAALELVLDQTSFYAEAGGQVGDTGSISAGEGRFTVVDTQRPAAGIIVHRGRVASGTIRVGDTVETAVDTARRADIRRNHTATHLIHQALRAVLGPHARQAGSLVAPDRLRFDFTHVQALTPAELRQVSDLANEAVLSNQPVETATMSQESALATGAMALFGEKYGDTVRVVAIGDLSKELCGGTHVGSSGEVGPIIVLGETSVASGVRRLEAVTGHSALLLITELQEITRTLSSDLRAPLRELPHQVDGLRARARELEREVAMLQDRLASGQVGAMLDRATDVAGVRLLATRVEATNPEQLRRIADTLRDRLNSGVLLLGAVFGERPALLSAVSPDLVARGIQAGALLAVAAKVLGGRGGGRPDLAQGGGGDPSRLDQALASAHAWLRDQLQADRERSAASATP